MATNLTLPNLNMDTPKKTLVLNSIFKEINLTDSKAKEKKTFRMEIIQKKTEIKKLLNKPIGDTKIYRIGQRKPSVLLEFEKGIKKTLFGENGQITKEIPQLHKELRYKKIKKIIKLDQKINIGPLTYYYLQENNGQEVQRRNEVKKCALKRSDYYIIQDEKELDIEPQQHKKRLSRNYHHPHLISNDYFTMINKTNIKDNRMLMDTIQQQMSPLDAKQYYNTLDSNNSYSHKKSLSSRTEQSTKNRITKTLAKSIISKASVIESNQGNLDKKLFKIIDNAHLEKPMPSNLKKDIEAIMGMKIKKHKQKNKTRDFVIQAVRIKDDYSNMDKNKAEMLKMSDDINKMSDEFAMTFGKELTKNYWKKSKGDKYNMPLEMVKEQIRHQRRLRQRINKNNFLLQKMEFNLTIKKQNLIDNMDSTLAKNAFE